MSSFDNNMRGVLFKAEKTDPRQPDYTGNIVVNNVEMNLAAWINTSRAGAKYMALKVSPKRDSAQLKPRAEDAQSAIPF